MFQYTKECSTLKAHNEQEQVMCFYMWLIWVNSMEYDSKM